MKRAVWHWLPSATRVRLFHETRAMEPSPERCLDRTTPVSRHSRANAASALAAVTILWWLTACTGTSTTASVEPAGRVEDADSPPARADAPVMPPQSADMPTGASSAQSEAPRPGASGGQSGEGGLPPADDCVGKLDDRGAIVATCSWWLGTSTPREYGCCCDQTRCGGGWSLDPTGCLSRADESDGGEAERCHIGASSCAAAMAEECAPNMAAGKNIAMARCLGYSSLGFVPCYERSDGGFACHCPGDAKPVEREDAQCEVALVRACAGTCDGVKGRCAFDGDRMYRCMCANGSSVALRAGTRGAPLLCTDALDQACGDN